MERKEFKELIQPYIRTDLIVMVLISLVVLYLRLWLGIVCLVCVVAVTVYHTFIEVKQTERKVSELRTRTIEENEEITRDFIDFCPVYMCVSDKEGNISWTNEGFRNEIRDGDSIADLISAEDLAELFESDSLQRIIRIGEGSYRVRASSKDESGHSKRMLYFENVSASEKLKELFQSSRACMAYVNVDNYEDLISASPVEKQSKIAAEIGQIISDWASEHEAVLVKTKSNQYAVIFEQKYMEKLRRQKGGLLEKIHGVETEADFPTTVSVGVSTGAANYPELQEWSADALDLALGRGGDQIVIKEASGELEYIGGGLPNLERRNKGKARIMAHALCKQIESSDKVLVMGHERADLDALGAACGVAALVAALRKKAYIVLNSPNEGIDIAYDAALQTERFEFINDETAQTMVQKDTLLVVVDTHIGPITECPALLRQCKKIIVIDHHRKSANAIENTIFSYMEPFASSAAELVCELLQYAGSNLVFGKFEMDVLLAGIALDTKNFTQNTGVRTYEASAWLRRNGADVKNVQSFFKMRLDFFQKKVNIIASAEILGNGFAVAYTKESDPSMQILTAQAADELLTMRGINAAFVAGALDDETTTVSARASGQINVQVIMEKLGGGGHVNIAAAQLGESPELAIQSVVKILREEKVI